MSHTADHQRRLVLVRHGHSEWNLTNRFTGWTDISLTELGLEESARCGQCVAAHRFAFDEVHVSALRRSRQTAERLLDAAAHGDIPYFTSWQLNERHYGQLQGMDKEMIFASWGEQQSRRWWRGYYESPPPLADHDPRHPRFDKLYADVETELLPAGESLEQCLQRVLPYWHNVIAPRIRQRRRLLVVTHGNTLRSLRMLVENISPDAIEHVEIPPAVPLVYSFTDDLELQHLEWLPLDPMG